MLQLHSTRRQRWLTVDIRYYVQRQSDDDYNLTVPRLGSASKGMDSRAPMLIANAPNEFDADGISQKCRYVR